MLFIAWGTSGHLKPGYLNPSPLLLSTIPHGCISCSIQANFLLYRTVGRNISKLDRGLQERYRIDTCCKLSGFKSLSGTCRVGLFLQKNAGCGFT